jgi:hypothetical protein
LLDFAHVADTVDIPRPYRINPRLTSTTEINRRLAGTEGSFGEQAGLPRDWVVRIIRSAVNYGEIFERNIGVESKLGIPRGLNQLWTNGGIVYARRRFARIIPSCDRALLRHCDHTPPPGTKQRM